MCIGITGEIGELAIFAIKNGLTMPLSGSPFFWRTEKKIGEFGVFNADNQRG